MPVSLSLDQKIEAYIALLLKWQKAINLVAKSTLKDVRDRHIDDSLTIIPHIRGVCGDKPALIYDLGSGGGFPALLIAMHCPEYDVHLVESDGRKCEFLKTVSRETHTPVSIHNQRLEDVVRQETAPDIITARAFSSLKNILDMTVPWTSKNNAIEMFLMKGASVQDEIDEAKATYNFGYKILPAHSDQGCVMHVTSVRSAN